MEEAIKLYLISGFLGAGKTTFIRGLLEQGGLGKVGIIVNEFGQTGIDGKLLENSGIQMTELTNGLIFCACLKQNFVKALQAYSALDIEALFIECSGLADPSSMNTLLKELTPHFKRPYSHQGSICLVDCSSFLDYADMLPAIEYQVKSADLLLLNKTDLATPEELAGLKATLVKLNPYAARYETTFAMVPSNLIAAVLKNSGYEAESINLQENRPLSMALPLPDLVCPDKLHTFCAKLQPHVWRIKGFALSTAGWLQTDVTAGQIDIKPSPLKTLQSPQDNCLVIIWREGERQKLARYKQELSAEDTI